MHEWFRKFAQKTAEAIGSPWAFLVALAAILLWALSGPVFHFSDTWQLIVNTATTISTGLIVFLIQNTQNRDARALHLKLDELLRSVAGARTGLIDLEHLSDQELERLQREFERLQRGQAAQRGQVAQVAGEVQQVGAAVREVTGKVHEVEHRVDEQGRRAATLAESDEERRGEPAA
jgi:low affinity Fe/Cu permease